MAAGPNSSIKSLLLSFVSRVASQRQQEHAGTVAYRRDLLHHGTGGLEKRGWDLRVLSDLEELEGFGPVWRSLLPGDSAPFSTFSWNMAWYRAFSDRIDEILVFVLYHNGAVSAVLPCYRQKNRIRLAGDTTCDYQDVISREYVPSKVCLQMVLRWMQCERPRGRVYFQKVADTGNLYKSVKELDQKANRIFVSKKWMMPCPCVELPESLDSYFASLPGKLRGDYRRCLKRLDKEAPGAEIRIYGGELLTADLIRESAGFHVRHFRKEGESPLADPALVSLLEEVAGKEETGLTVCVLWHDNTVMALDFGFVRNGTFYGYLIDFDEAYRRLSPGKCLLLKRIELWAASNEVGTLDLLGGDESYKKGFTMKNEYRVYSFHLFPRRPLSAVAWLCVESELRLRRFAKRMRSEWKNRQRGRK